MSPRNLAALQSCLPSTEASGTWLRSINIQGMSGNSPGLGTSVWPDGGAGPCPPLLQPPHRPGPINPVSAAGKSRSSLRAQNHTLPQRDVPRLKGEGAPPPPPPRASGQQDVLTHTPFPGACVCTKLPHQQPVHWAPYLIQATAIRQQLELENHLYVEDLKKTFFSIKTWRYI